jgi:hypothetical protein
MRELSFDQYEFPCSGSEESLYLVIAGKRQCPDLRSFALAGCGYTEPRLSEFLARASWRSLAEFDRLDEVEARLIEFALLDIPDPTSSRLLVLANEWCDLDLIVELPERFIWYRWSTTA